MDTGSLLTLVHTDGGAGVLCPGMDASDYCDCSGDCGGPFCQCPEALSCCGGSGGSTDGYYGSPGYQAGPPSFEVMDSNDNGCISEEEFGLYTMPGWPPFAGIASLDGESDCISSQDYSIATSPEAMQAMRASSSRSAPPPPAPTMRRHGWHGGMDAGGGGGFMHGGYVCVFVCVCMCIYVYM